ncbi:MAG: DUF711 family protein [Dehalococcoidia bacterium]|nr:DUF711 family protein [Dehalococcoidia bacterium]
MRIRAITYGQRQSLPIRLPPLQRAAAFLATARAAYTKGGYQVQTLRAATQPASDLLRGCDAPAAVAAARDFDAACAGAGIDLCSLGPIIAAGHNGPHPLIKAIPAMLAATDRIFLTVMAATPRHGINLDALQQAADALVQIARGAKPDGDARRYAVTAAIPPHGPFFPSAYHRGAGDAFSIAIEAADLAVDAFTGASSLAHAQQRLLTSVEKEGKALVRIARTLERRHAMRFRGLDISLAPYPAPGIGIAEAIERLTGAPFGTHGTLFAAALITNVLRRADLPTCGFSGLMIPLLEDAVMTQRHAEGRYGLNSLLLYSTVCGAGLDTIPVPGDITAGQAASLYLDMSTLAVVHRKPLTVRLIPMPGKQAGDPVRFDFPYFAPATVAALRGPGSPALFDKGAWKPLHTAKRNR